MIRTGGHRPSPALVIALIALFIALGGTGYATVRLDRHGDNTRASAKKKPKHADRGADKKLVLALAPTLSVKHAATAGRAGLADRATTADKAASLPAAAPWQNVTFQAGWSAFGAPFAAPQCYRDQIGIVRLRGVAKINTGAPGVSNQILDLPLACRPSYSLIAPASRVTPIGDAVTNPDSVRIDPNGRLSMVSSPSPNDGIGEVLDGISFRPTN